jgi:hypothetical protein
MKSEGKIEEIDVERERRRLDEQVDADTGDER